MSDNNYQREEIFAKSVRAGKRTYFFDVKSTRANDYYLTITESKRRTADDGTPIYEKHKIFLYREDFEKFMDGFNETISKINELIEANPPTPYEHRSQENNSAEPNDSKPDSGAESNSGTGFTDVNFEDLK